MEKSYALFVKRYAVNDAYGHGIIIPIGAYRNTPKRLTGRFRGWVNCDRERAATWAPYRSFTVPPIFEDDGTKARYMACSIDRVEIQGDVESVVAPCFILPYTPGIVHAEIVEVEMKISSLFQTAELQNWAWSALTVNIVTGGLIDTPDTSVFHAAKKMAPAPGDAYPVLVGEHDGVLELLSASQERTFKARLWLLEEGPAISSGTELVSKHIDEVDGVIGVFHRVIATIK